MCSLSDCPHHRSECTPNIYVRVQQVNIVVRFRLLDLHGLCKTKEGVDALRESGHIGRMTRVVRGYLSAPPGEATPPERFKGVLWALGHISSCPMGVHLLPGDLVDAVVLCAERAKVISVRGTCVYVLGLMGLTPAGHARLRMLGWLTRRHARAEGQ